MHGLTNLKTDRMLPQRIHRQFIYVTVHRHGKKIGTPLALTINRVLVVSNPFAFIWSK